jgi:hypothetical protein
MLMCIHPLWAKAKRSTTSQVISSLPEKAEMFNRIKPFGVGRDCQSLPIFA